MPISHDVSLPKAAVPVFPRRCVSCGCDRPDDLYILAARGTHLLSVLLPFIPGRRVEVEVPCCRSCRVSMVRRRWLLSGFQLLVVFGGLSLVVVLATHLDGVLEDVSIWGGGVLVALALLYFEFFRPPAFGMTPSTRSVCYEFADEIYAAEFAALNGGEVE